MYTFHFDLCRLMFTLNSWTSMIYQIFQISHFCYTTEIFLKQSDNVQRLLYKQDPLFYIINFEDLPRRQVPFLGFEVIVSGSYNAVM
jgi:hypothetical protein